ncbi:MBL fold metallo-hydrolase [Catalinimonas niigatensis]|uniref:MBL fold metallo-hydrolase n=1 Tax=Catalinimonas niigatensis TaxID=1397264 RepID=UPI002665767C|nr:MBL fold metallo-hydrolase [Catalinimonas niigatensis]WPP49865.1 MBL fold metallo-hydrolase [Catalinimonas niigatensis]
MIVWSILGLFALILVTGFFFLRLSPVFGGAPSELQKERYTQSGHFQDGKFINQITTTMDMSVRDYVGLTMEYLRGTPNSKPAVPLPVLPLDSTGIINKPDESTRLTWFGHSAILLELEGKNILIDPMLGESPSPHPWLGSKRYGELPIEVEQLPHLDAVIISHDHYDHLDYGSIQKLKDKVDKFYTPLGVGTHLEAWGVEKSKIHELNWWEEILHGQITFVCTPARHFSGRGLQDRNKTLWASWVIISAKDTIYFSGDSGYGPHFKEIGERYGPFAFAMMECGQYDTRWEAIHMLPEQTVQAALDVRADLIMPIHWGAFTLAMHSWTDPIERVTKQAQAMSVNIATPKIGEPIILNQTNFPNSSWWESTRSNE